MTQQDDVDNECEGECVTRPHLWTLGGRGKCERPCCDVIGSGDPCGDGDCLGGVESGGNDLGLLEALECIYLGGFANEISGDVEAPMGHAYRVDRHVVVTDSLGFKERVTFDTELEAATEFSQFEIDYAAWLGDE